KNVLEFPEIITAKKKINAKRINLLKNINDFDWLIFTDIFTVDYFLEELEVTGFELYELDKFRICACGEAVADKLRFGQIHSDVIPVNSDEKIIISGIKDYIFDEEEFQNSNFLIVKPENKNSELSKLLNDAKIQNDEIEIYKIATGENLENAKHGALLFGGAIDKFIFTSPADIESLLLLAKNKKLSELLSGVKIDATDEITAQTLRERGLQI
ncbi:MAG: uroporphyrinogen-III synthase, partial [Pyrinomonadaceae bacterium]